MTNAPFFVDNEVIELNSDGVWIADGYEISHQPTRDLFARSLKRNMDGYYLHIGRETKKILVQDTAYFVLRVDGDPDSVQEILINDRRIEKLSPQKITYTQGRLVYWIERDGQPEAAKFLRPAYMDFLKDLQSDSQGYFVIRQSVRIDLGRLS